MNKRYAGDFDPSTPVIELCRYSSEIERANALEQELGITKIALEHKKTLLNSCETALAERDVFLDKANEMLNAVGYTYLGDGKYQDRSKL